MSEYKLVVQKKVAPVINFSHEEILKSLEDTLNKYENIVVTSETVKGNKKVLAELNAAKKEIDTFRKTVKKEMNAPIKAFEDKCKEIICKIDEVYSPIKIQMDGFIEHQRKEKAEHVELVIQQTQEEIPLKPKYLEMIERKDKYLNATESLTKVKKDIVDQFNNIKLKQDMEQMKIDTVNAILTTHNEKLKFAFTFDDFERYIKEETSVAELNQIVITKVQGRIDEEQAELERIRIEKEEAVKRAKEEAEHKAKEESERKERERKAKEEAEEKARLQADREKERLHQNELRKKELEAESLVREAERKAEAVVKQVDKFIPVVEEETETILSVKLNIQGSKNQLQALKEYMNASGITYTKIK